ncbi:hypothetical protein GGTG_08636 [Gaeumannomyces tritici R3-111a-1]|uniref:Uncharacterized protein n=1 Tax=Gaeumannomyces tritici (strain R3-111a-1) TaxID=644352 RepID=J3P550_GAET3|nr:hypothetical protein GGTG_08636 [Gaeumannomyces tritici R3-111a-1]EJT74798.1 hypothetical protein GGTG_08636 [Gaeumannomyces tritici R3-111a-1]
MDEAIGRYGGCGSPPTSRRAISSRHISNQALSRFSVKRQGCVRWRDRVPGGGFPKPGDLCRCSADLRPSGLRRRGAMQHTSNLDRCKPSMSCATGGKCLPYRAVSCREDLCPLKPV